MLSLNCLCQGNSEKTFKMQSGSKVVMSLARQGARKVRCSRGSRGVQMKQERMVHTNSQQLKEGLDQRFLPSLIIGAVGVSGFVAYGTWHQPSAIEPLPPTMVPIEKEDDGVMLEFSLPEVQRHTDLESGVWVTYGDEVFDITEFVESHPGGQKIMLAAGGALEPHWDIYTMHKSQEIRDMLDYYKIGFVKKDAAYYQSKKASKAAANATDPYKNEPARHPELQVNCLKPFDADPPSSVLAKEYYTPTDMFYVRNHLPVPQIDPMKYELTVNLPEKESVKISLGHLKKNFKKRDIVASLQCAGNRRDTMARFRQVYGMSVGHTQISNAKWSGVFLRDVLKHAGISSVDMDKIRFVELEGLDKDTSGEGYKVSIPIEKALSPVGDVLLAYEMNGQDISPDHGYPVRVVVPGMIGARSVKWLGKITLKEAECTSNYQKNDYKSSPPSAEQTSFSFHCEPPINEMPVNSAVCDPVCGQSLPSGAKEVTARGYAISGGGNGILRVDVSLDGGKTWQTADLQNGGQRRYRAWGWTLWSANLQIPDDHQGELNIVCKAVDSAHNVQPEHVAGIWNIRGYLNNAWHNIKISIPIPEEPVVA